MKDFIKAELTTNKMGFHKHTILLNPNEILFMLRVTVTTYEDFEITLTEQCIKSLESKFKEEFISVRILDEVLLDKLMNL